MSRGTFPCSRRSSCAEFTAAFVSLNVHAVQHLQAQTHTHIHTSCPILPLLAAPAEGFHVNYLLWFDDVITELVRAAGEVTSPVATKVLLCPAASRLSCIT